MSEPELLNERRPVTVGAEPWAAMHDRSGFIPEGPSYKQLMDPAREGEFVLMRFPPDYVAPSHWHPSDTVYIITQGLFIVEGEGEYRPGQIRWVGGGYAYGAETAGPEGCEFYLLSLGPFSIHDPDEEAPPRGGVAGG